MKVCEYDNIKCPSCGEGSPEYEDSNRNLCGLREVDKGNYQGKTFGPMHLIQCLTCGIRFGIPCED